MTDIPFLPLFFALKWRLGNNHLADLRRHKWVHFVVALSVLVMIVAGGTFVFDLAFSFLMSQEPFGGR